jgi:WD repeat-containing protein 68
MSVAEARENKKKEIYTYKVPWTAYCLAWCRRQDDKFKMAVGSYKEEYSNKIQIIQRRESDKGENDDDNQEGKFVQLSECEHPYPATKVMWAPAKNNTGL